MKNGLLRMRPNERQPSENNLRLYIPNFVFPNLYSRCLPLPLLFFGVATSGTTNTFKNKNRLDKHWRDKKWETIKAALTLMKIKVGFSF